MQHKINEPTLVQLQFINFKNKVEKLQKLESVFYKVKCLSLKYLELYLNLSTFPLLCEIFLSLFFGLIFIFQNLDHKSISYSLGDISLARWSKWVDCRFLSKSHFSYSRLQVSSGVWTLVGELVWVCLSHSSITEYHLGSLFKPSIFILALLINMSRTLLLILSFNDR